MTYPALSFNPQIGSVTVPGIITGPGLVSLIKQPPPPRPRPFVEPNTQVVVGRQKAIGGGTSPVYGQKPVTSFSHGGMGVARPAPARTVKKVPKVVVKIHPNGHIEIHHTAPAPEAPAAPQAAPVAPRVAPRKQPARVVAQAPAVAPAPQQTLQQQAQALLAPAVAAATDPINARIAAQQAAITGSTQELADLMGKYAPASKAIYGGAQQAQAAVDSATGSTLAGQGQSGQDALAAKLQAIDADPVTAARLNGAAAGNVTGATGALAAHGSSALSNLISQGASAQDMGAKLPGVAGEFGLQATRTAQRQGTDDLANAEAAIQAKYPDVVNQIKTENVQQKQIRFEHGAALLQANGGVVTPQIKALLGDALSVGATPKAKADAAKTAAAAAKAAQSQANTDRNYKLSVAKFGLSEAKLQAELKKSQQTAATKGKLHGLSQNEYQGKAAYAAGLARIAHTPTADGQPPVSWQQYLNGGLAHKVPFWILIEQGKRVYSQAEIRQGLIPGKK